VLLSGPPGTGKSSLCLALAEKLAIRVGKRAFYLQVGCQTLLSKWYSESGKLIRKLFEDVRFICQEYPTSMVILVFDEIESIVVSRESSFSGNEPSDSIRVCTPFSF
jgi:SpoVK/Ycf46/Vps4 family AAA+-type ATPase